MSGFCIKHNNSIDDFFHHVESLSDSNLVILRDLIFEDFTSDEISSVDFSEKITIVNNELASRFVRLIRSN